MKKLTLAQSKLLNEILETGWPIKFDPIYFEYSLGGERLNSRTAGNLLFHLKDNPAYMVDKISGFVDRYYILALIKLNGKVIGVKDDSLHLEIGSVKTWIKKDEIKASTFQKDTGLTEYIV